MPVDELRSGLELATDDELYMMTELMFQPKFNPLDYLCTPMPVDVCSYDREAQIDLLEQRFRYLAADGLTVLQNRTHQVSYRHALLRVCRYLKIRRYRDLSVAELEAEVFLALLERTWQQMPVDEQTAVSHQLKGAIATTQEFNQLPALLQQNPAALLAKGSSAFALSAIVRPWLLRQIAHQFTLHMARYQVAKQTLVKGGLTAAAQMQSKVAAKAATQGMVRASARYGATRGLLSCLGPALWTWFLADLGWRAIATNYARVIPVVFTLAQIRLTRDENIVWSVA